MAKLLPLAVERISGGSGPVCKQLLNAVAKFVELSTNYVLDSIVRDFRQQSQLLVNLLGLIFDLLGQVWDATVGQYQCVST